MNIRERVDKLIVGLHTVIDEVEPYLIAERVPYFRSYIDNSEVGVGVEILIENLLEDDIGISEKSYEILKSVPSYAISDEGYMESLEYLRSLGAKIPPHK